jgi:hypothetical protein
MRTPTKLSRAYHLRMARRCHQTMVVAVVLSVVLFALFIASYPLQWHFWVKVLLVPAFLSAVLAIVERRWQREEHLQQADVVEAKSPEGPPPDAEYQADDA